MKGGLTRAPALGTWVHRRTQGPRCPDKGFFIDELWLRTHELGGAGEGTRVWDKKDAPFHSDIQRFLPSVCLGDQCRPPPCQQPP